MDSSAVQQLRVDRAAVEAALRFRSRVARARLGAGLQAGVDAELDRDLRDVALLGEMSRELTALLRELGGSPRAGLAGLPVPAWLWAAVPSGRYRTVLDLRRQGRSWREIERETGIRAGNAAAMARDVVRAAQLWPWVVRARAAGLGRREIGHLFGLPRWAVRAVLTGGPPLVAEGPPLVAEGPPLVAEGPPDSVDGPPLPAAGRSVSLPTDGGQVRERGRTTAGEGNPAAGAPGSQAEWVLLRTDPGRTLHAKAEIEQRFRGRVRCLALVRPGESRPAVAGLLAVRTVSGVSVEQVPHVRGAVASVSEAELAAWLRALGWTGLPGGAADRSDGVAESRRHGSADGVHAEIRGERG
jgi:hypothetical protein